MIAENIIKNRVIFIRCDFNVSIYDDQILDDTRLRSHYETINYYVENNNTVILGAHLGRPDILDKEHSLMRILSRLKEILKQDILFAKNLYELRNLLSINNSIILLENLRFFSGEQSKNIDERLYFVHRIAALCDYYIGDGFSVMHKKDSTVYLLPKFLPHIMGSVAKRELNGLQVLNIPKKPYMSIIGGNKLDTKLSVINSLIKKVDYLLIGGRISQVFISAIYDNIFNIKNEELEEIDLAKEILDNAKFNNTKIILPDDYTVSNSTSEGNQYINCYIKDVQNYKYGLFGDIGTQTVDKFCDILLDAKTVLWNGPLGIYKDNNFQNGTKQILKKIYDLTLNNSLISVIGGGDSLSALNMLGFKVNNFTYVSMGGGATLSYIANNGVLPGLEVLKKK